MVFLKKKYNSCTPLRLMTRVFFSLDKAHTLDLIVYKVPFPFKVIVSKEGRDTDHHNRT